jgi:hypothetical protein
VDKYLGLRVFVAGFPVNGTTVVKEESIQTVAERESQENSPND